MAEIHQFRLGLCPDPAGEAYSAAETLAGFKGLLLTGGGRERREG